MSWITDNICSFLTDFIGGTIDFFGEFINNIFFFMVTLNENNVYVIGAEKYVVALALALVSFMIVKQVLSGYIMQTDYDSEADPFDLIVRIAQCVAIICCSGWIFNQMLSFAKKFASDLIRSTSDTGVGGELSRLLEVDPIQLGGMLLCHLALVLIMLVAFIIFTFVSAFRACELIAMKLFLPLFALDLLTTSREKWNNYFTGYLIAFLSYGVQILFFNIALKCMASCNPSRPQYSIATLVWIYLSIKAPKFLEKYLYTSGISKAASGGIRMVAQVAAIKAV